jgi:hypothetical protein
MHILGRTGGGVPFAPINIPNCVLWLIPDLGIVKDGSNLVSLWTDQSTNGWSFHEATNKPLWEANQVNGHPSVRFDGVSRLADTPPYSINRKSPPHTQFIVFNPDTLDASQRPVFGSPSGQRTNLILKNTSTYMRCDDLGNLVSSQTIGTGSWVMVRLKLDYFTSPMPRSSSIHINGIERAVGIQYFSFSAYVGLGYVIGIGGFIGRIAEWIIYNRFLLAGEISQIETYLNARYGL